LGAVTPTTTKSTSGYVDPHLGMYGGVVPTDTDSMISNGKHYSNRYGFKETIWFFSSVDHDDTWASGIPNIVAVFWQSDVANTDEVGAVCTAKATGTIKFQCAANGAAGWLLVKSLV